MAENQEQNLPVIFLCFNTINFSSLKIIIKKKQGATLKICEATQMEN